MLEAFFAWSDGKDLIHEGIETKTGLAASIFALIDGKDLIHEGIETKLINLQLSLNNNKDGKDLIHEGIETFYLASIFLFFVLRDGKDLIHEGIETKAGLVMLKKIQHKTEKTWFTKGLRHSSISYSISE